MRGPGGEKLETVPLQDNYVKHSMAPDDGMCYLEIVIEVHTVVPGRPQERELQKRMDRRGPYPEGSSAEPS